MISHLMETAMETRSEAASEASANATLRIGAIVGAAICIVAPDLQDSHRSAAIADTKVEAVRRDFQHDC